MRPSTSGHKSNSRRSTLIPDFRLEVRVFLEYLADQPFEMPHIPTQGLQHLRRFSTGASFWKRQFQDLPSE